MADPSPRFQASTATTDDPEDPLMRRLIGVDVADEADPRNAAIHRPIVLPTAMLACGA
jgi:hypothetical protein